MGKFKMPTAFTILFCHPVVVMTLLTWVVPSGVYDYQENGEPVAGSYHLVDNEAQPLPRCSGPLGGTVWAIDIAAFILMVGGFLGVMAKTGALDAGIANIIRACWPGGESCSSPF